MFANQDSGFFVEVGCIDGRRFSNTLTFEELGWRGLCIEAHADYIGMLACNRPNSTIVHCAVGPEDKDNVPFFANARGSLSTLDRSREPEFRSRFGDYFNGFVQQEVPMLTLDTILKREGVTSIDILSLDIEGSEVEALRGLDLHRFQPRVFVVESDHRTHEKALDRILLPAGYFKSFRIADNIFYITDRQLARLVSNKQFSVILRHTRHPLDAGADEVVQTAIDTRPYIPRMKRIASQLERRMRALWWSRHD
jgi:FkbM family methyltransferase